MSITKPGKPHTFNDRSIKSDHVLGVYLFDDNEGSLVTNIAGPNPDLSIISDTAVGLITSVTDAWFETDEGISVALNADADGNAEDNAEGMLLTTYYDIESIDRGTIIFRIIYTEADQQQALISNVNDATFNDANHFIWRIQNSDELRVRAGNLSANLDTEDKLVEGQTYNLILTWKDDYTAVYINEDLASETNEGLNLNSELNWSVGAVWNADTNELEDECIANKFQYFAMYSEYFTPKDVERINQYIYETVDPLITVRYPTHSDPNLVDTSITDYRVTRFMTKSSFDDIIATQWRFFPQETSSFQNSFVITTQPNGSGTTNSGNIIDSDLNRLDMWLPPFQNYSIQTRQRRVDGSWTSWSSKYSIPTRGYENSFDRYQILSRAGQTIG